MTLVYPPPITPGDLIAVVAPSSPFPAADFWPGLAWLRARYRLRMRPDALARDAYLAGSDERRACELARAMIDPEVKAIVAARGGYGATRILDALPWDELARRPKWLAGFSDVTALHAELWRRGIASVHGPHVTGLAFSAATPARRAAFLAALERPGAPRVWEGLRVLREGAASGVLVGGNLALIEAMACARRLVVPDGAILALEDVTERPYRIDRMLTSLRLGGYFARLGGIVFGEFDQCDAGADGRGVDEVLAERTKDLGIPVYAGAPFGHGKRNDAFVLGSRAVMGGGRVELAGG